MQHVTLASFVHRTVSALRRQNVSFVSSSVPFIVVPVRAMLGSLEPARARNTPITRRFPPTIRSDSQSFRTIASFRTHARLDARNR